MRNLKELNALTAPCTEQVRIELVVLISRRQHQLDNETMKVYSLRYVLNRRIGTQID